MPSGKTEIYVPNDFSIYLAIPDDALRLNKLIRKELKTFKTVEINLKHVVILTQEFIRLAFVEIAGISPIEARQRLVFKYVDASKKYLIKTEFSKAEKAFKALNESPSKPIKKALKKS